MKEFEVTSRSKLEEDAFLYPSCCGPAEISRIKLRCLHYFGLGPCAIAEVVCLDLARRISYDLRQSVFGKNMSCIELDQDAKQLLSLSHLHTSDRYAFTGPGPYDR